MPGRRTRSYLNAMSKAFPCQPSSGLFHNKEIESDKFVVITTDIDGVSRLTISEAFAEGLWRVPLRGDQLFRNGFNVRRTHGCRSVLENACTFMFLISPSREVQWGTVNRAGVGVGVYHCVENHQKTTAPLFLDRCDSTCFIWND